MSTMSPRRRRRYTLPIAAATAVTGFCGLVAATPAQAGGLLCVYVDRQYSTPLQCFDRNGGYMGPALNDKVTSVRNSTGVTMCLYDAGRGSLSLPIGPGHQYANLSFNAAQDGRSWNDRVSSVWPAPC